MSEQLVTGGFSRDITRGNAHRTRCYAVLACTLIIYSLELKQLFLYIPLVNIMITADFNTVSYRNH